MVMDSVRRIVDVSPGQLDSPPTVVKAGVPKTGSAWMRTVKTSPLSSSPSVTSTSCSDDDVFEDDLPMSTASVCVSTASASTLMTMPPTVFFDSIFSVISTPRSPAMVTACDMPVPCSIA